MLEQTIPAFLTAVVGLAGILSTYAIARSARRDAAEAAAAGHDQAVADRLREERRLAYVHFLGVLEQDRPYQREITNIPEPATLMAMVRVLVLKGRFRQALANVRLVASDDVAARIEVVVEAFHRPVALRRRTRIAADAELSHLVEGLRQAMQADLGYRA